METDLRFIQFLNKFIPFTQEDYNRLLKPYVHVRKFDKKVIILHAGETENYINFIISGLVRKYYKKGNEEINTQISFENHIIHAQESFHSRKPSEYTIETIEPTVLVSIDYDDLEKAYAASHKMEHMGRLIITTAMIVKDSWQMQMITLSPRERFIKFVNKNPDLVQRVPQKFLASFLYIKPETFSRFKHLLKDANRKS
jgi:CRP-like cAMP-binding protein